jgi:hypothetical protein
MPFRTIVSDSRAVAASYFPAECGRLNWTTGPCRLACYGCQPSHRSWFGLDSESAATGGNLPASKPTPTYRINGDHTMDVASSWSKSILVPRRLDLSLRGSCGQRTLSWGSGSSAGAVRTKPGGPVADLQFCGRASGPAGLSGETRPASITVSMRAGHGGRTLADTQGSTADGFAFS